MLQISDIVASLTYASNNNAVLIDGCNNLQNLTVLLEVGLDIATINNGGWSLQLNCYVPPGHYCQTSQINVLQYIVIVQGGILEYYIQYWAVGASLPWPAGYTPQAGTTPWLPCWAHDFGDAPTFATGLSGDTLPRDSKLQIALGTDSNGGVDTATFTYTDPEGKAQTGVFVPPVAHPICAFELNFVGPPGGTATFTPSAPSALISYSISAGKLSVQSGGVGSACGEVNAITAETSNMTYSDISGAPGSTVTQILQPPITWVAPSTLTFPAQQIGTSSLQQTVTVFAGSQVTLTGISFIDNTPGASADFASVPGPGGGNLNLQNGQLVITVWFRPTAGGTRNAQLLIAHNSAGSPLIVELSGVGNVALLPLLKFSPPSLLFTTTKITNHIVTLTNTGTGPLTINSIAIDRPSSFTFGTTCNVGPSGGILNPGQTCTITVSYHGVVSSNANLVITHNAVGSPAMIGIEADLGKGPSR
jgi:hypothetical protein